MARLPNTTSSLAYPDDFWKYALLTHIQAPYYWIAFWYQQLILAVFLTNRELLITPFNIYLIDMLVSYTLGTGLRFISETASIVSGTYVYRGVPWCPVRILSEWVVSPTAALGHVLLAINRIWAVTSPHSYRTSHTKAVAIAACMVINAAAYGTRLPHFIMAWHGSGNRTICAVNTTVFPDLYYSVKYISPAAGIVVFGAFPYVVLMRRLQRNRISTNIARPHQVFRNQEFSVFAWTTLVSFILWVPIIITSLFYPTWRLLNDSLRLWSLLAYIVDPTVFVLLAPNARAAFVDTIRGKMSGRRPTRKYERRVHSIKLLAVKSQPAPLVCFQKD